MKRSGPRPRRWQYLFRSRTIHLIRLPLSDANNYLQLSSSAKTRAETPTAAEFATGAAITRSLRKASFRWAEKEQRALLKRQDETQNGTDGSERAAEPAFEHVSVLNDFLDYCTRQGLLSRFERGILLRFKVDGLTHKEIQNRHTVLSDQAVRLRLHRIMQRLQETALSLSTRTEGANNGSRQITALTLKKSEKGMKHFSLKHSTDVLPISKSRGQISLDCSLPSEGE